MVAPPLAAGLWRTAALATPWTVRPEDLAAIQDAHARGTRVVQKWAANGNGDGHAAEAGVTGARGGWIRWMSSRGDRHTPVDDLTTIVHLGGLQPSPRSSWGAAQPLNACLCHAIPVRSVQDVGYAGDHEAIATTFIEAVIRVTLELQKRSAPAALAPGVLMLVISDVIESALLAHPTDVRGLIAAVEGIPTTRFDDYIAAIAARGPLVPVEDPGSSR
jgi:hypothetical protein